MSLLCAAFVNKVSYRYVAYGVYHGNKSNQHQLVMIGLLVDQRRNNSPVATGVLGLQECVYKFHLRPRGSNGTVAVHISATSWYISGYA